ncbi:MAG: aminoglycoside phosphotransferase family protein [Thermoleophilia bacterium]|nr:aminoglycoside phosphotransferase family protein [Thermoleophilia bacterium]
MREIVPENAAEYLRETGRVPPGRPIAVEALGWGVSNVVIRAQAEGEAPIILKQARQRLRVKMVWVSRLERIWTERAALDLLAGLLPEGSVPRVLFADEPNFLFAMTCAPEPSAVWKEQLLAGTLDEGVARRAGTLLGTIHARTRSHPALKGRLADATVFDELRVDPFYRTSARVHPSFAPALDALSASMFALPEPERCLVLGDFSPKNMLVHPGAGAGLTLVDFETAHAGDPAYDLGFFLSHLWLKSLRAARTGIAGGYESYRGLDRAFRTAYEAVDPTLKSPALWRRAAGHLAGNVLARVDGKSPVDYLDEPARDAARRVALALLRHPAEDWATLERVAADEASKVRIPA